MKIKGSPFKGRSLFIPELLSPAGDMDCFMAAINAGADAIYLAGRQFGARAYAGNFSKEELIFAIRYAHLFDVKVYLTVNTLIKEREKEELLEYTHPFVKEGLDGFIVQDMGAASKLLSTYPKTPVHASTQMCITGAEGAKLLKNMGFSRVILARECSLLDIANVCAVMDTEVFIHGAMCYSYSGQCLFSSMLGERSANRGRCAGPCRMEYDGKYLLSLSDVCAIEYLPGLIEAGAKSLKIEGRMKPASYVSAITSIYRKYLDIYKEKGSFALDEADRKVLEGIYHRGGIATGYLESEKGQQPVTIKSPSYSDSGNIEIKEPLRKTIPVDMEVDITENESLRLKLSAKGVSVFVKGAQTQSAQSAPLRRDAVIKQLSKLGGSAFGLNSIDVNIKGNAFCPVSALNELRRKGISALEETILLNYGK